MQSCAQKIHDMQAVHSLQDQIAPLDDIFELMDYESLLSDEKHYS